MVRTFRRPRFRIPIDNFLLHSYSIINPNHPIIRRHITLIPKKLPRTNQFTEATTPGLRKPYSLNGQFCTVNILEVADSISARTRQSWGLSRITLALPSKYLASILNYATANSTPYPLHIIHSFEAIQFTLRISPLNKPNTHPLWPEALQWKRNLRGKNIINWMKQNPSWQASSHSGDQEVSACYGTWGRIVLFKRSSPYILLKAAECSPRLEIISIISPHLYITPPPASVLIPSDFLYTHISYYICTREHPY